MAKELSQGLLLRQALANLNKELDAEEVEVVNAIVKAVDKVRKGEVKEEVGTDEDEEEKS